MGNEYWEGWRRHCNCPSRQSIYNVWCKTLNTLSTSFLEQGIRITTFHPPRKILQTSSLYRDEVLISDRNVSLPNCVMRITRHTMCLMLLEKLLSSLLRFTLLTTWLEMTTRSLVRTMLVGVQLHLSVTLCYIVYSWLAKWGLQVRVVQDAETRLKKDLLQQKRSSKASKLPSTADQSRIREQMEADRLERLSKLSTQ